MNDLSLMELHVVALFHHDQAGRITGTNDGEPPGIAPRVYLGRTLKGSLWRLRDDVPDELAADLSSILETEPIADDLRHSPTTLPQLIGIMSRAGFEVDAEQGPAYRFPVAIPSSSEVVIVDGSTINVVKEHFPDHYPWLASEFSIRRPITAILRDGDAVSMCYSARLTVNAAEAGVDTAPRYRGQGFAALVTAEWAQEIRRMGRIPLYSTSWDNSASQRVARKLGLLMYGSELSVG